METYSEDTIVKDVRTAIDENTSYSAFTDAEGDIVDADTLEMDDIIRSKVADGLNAVRLSAPLSVLELSAESPAVTWTDKTKCIGRVALPTDYMRLAMFKMSDWAMGVSECISPASALYRQQFSEWKGVRGNPSRPVIALSADPSTGGGTIEFFSCDTTDATASLLYVKRTAKNTSYDIEAAIYRAVVLKTGALVMASYSNAELAQQLNALSIEQITNKV